MKEEYSDEALEVLSVQKLIDLGYAGSRATVWRMVKDGRLPPKLPCGGWTRTQLREWSLKNS